MNTVVGHIAKCWDTSRRSIAIQWQSSRRDMNGLWKLGLDGLLRQISHRCTKRQLYHITTEVGFQLEALSVRYLENSFKIVSHGRKSRHFCIRNLAFSNTMFLSFCRCLMSTFYASDACARDTAWHPDRMDIVNLVQSKDVTSMSHYLIDEMNEWMEGRRDLFIVTRSRAD